jgi:hypothetical protein
MTVYATNPTATKGIVKSRAGQDYCVPAGVQDFVISAITMDDIIYQSSYLIVTAERQGVFVDQAQPEFAHYQFRFQGYIYYSTDFPYPHLVSKGDMYIVKGDQVIDNSITRTNTGQTFFRENEIFWDGDEWELSDSDTTSLSWGPPVKEIRNDPPVSPSDGDRYLIGTSPTGLWASNANYAAEWDATAGVWRFEAPTTNRALFVEDLDVGYTYDADTTTWVQFTGIGSLVGGPGIDKTGDTLSVDVDPSGGLAFDVGGNAGKLLVSVIDGGTS